MVVILGLLSLTALQKNAEKAPDAEPAATGQAAGKSINTLTLPQAGASGLAEFEIMKPLLDLFPGGEGETDRINSVFKQTGSDQAQDLTCLIATVPDPLQSTNSHRFDEWVGAIQRACESAGFVLDGFRIPWGSGAASTSTTQTSAPNGGGDLERVRLDLSSATLHLDRKPAPPRPTRQPGLLLYRRTATMPGSPDTLLIVFLVPETPTLGLDKKVFGETLGLAAKWDVRNRPDHPKDEFNILGPSFSGSQRSLEQSIASWCDGKKEQQSFAIISGGASAIEKSKLEACVLLPHHVSFFATTHRSTSLLSAMLKYIGQKDDIALLTETGTEFGRKLQNLAGNTSGQERPSHDEMGKTIVYPFPLHISKLRGYYEKKGPAQDQVIQALRSPERLTIPFEETGDPQDIPAIQTPGFTTAVEELVLTQILTDIKRRDIRKVGIIATDPLDIIFLARRVRKLCPGVQLFTTQAHLVYTHPQYVADLRGMLVAATYPLYPVNQLWSYSYTGDTTHLFFSSDSTQATYNAAVAHLDRFGDATRSPRYLEYGDPFDPPGNYRQRPDGTWVWDEKPRKPPIWISVVGHHGFYPVRTVPNRTPEDSDHGYVLTHKQKESEYRGLNLQTPAGGTRDDRSWERIRGWFRPYLPTFWLFLFGGLSLVCLAMVGVNFFVYRWSNPDARQDGVGGAEVDPGRWAFGPTPTGGLSQFLNCSRPKDAANEGPCRGPGLYMTAALLVLMVVYLTISVPVLEVIWIVPWTPIHYRYRTFWIGLIAYTIFCFLSASIVLSLATSSGARPLAPRPKWVLWGIVVLLVGVVLAPPVWRVVQAVAQEGRAYAFDRLKEVEEKEHDVRRDGLFRLARGVSIPSGVSPVLSMVFLGTAAMAWIHAQLRRRFIQDQFTPRRTVVSTDETLRVIGERHHRFQEILTSPITMLLHTHFAVILIVVLCTGFFVLPLITRSLTWQGNTLDGPLFEKASALMFCVLFGLLAFHTLQLILLWSNMDALLELILRLPLAPALDRIPSRVANWLKEPPRPGTHRFDLIQRQARALAFLSEAEDGAARIELEADLKSSIDPATWKALIQAMKGLEQRSVKDVRDPILGYLMAHWEPIPIRLAYPDAGSPVRMPDPAEGKVVDALHNIALAVKGGSLVPPEPPKKLPEWIRHAEELLALLLLRWLSTSMAQVWILIEFLVIGSTSMLLAISSYPFLFQDRLMLGLALLIGILVVSITVIVVGFNRDELVSRVSNTAPNQLTLDQHLVGGILTYVVPLLGVLTALSFDTSDTLRSLLDPILRHLR